MLAIYRFQILRDVLEESNAEFGEIVKYLISGHANSIVG